MPDSKLSALTTGGAIADTDLFYSGEDIGGGLFSSVKQPASAIRTYINARQLLTANRTYFFRGDGSDTTCNGLTNASSASAPNGAFQTPQKAFDTAASLDLQGFLVLLQAGVASQTFASTVNGVGAIGVNINSSSVGGGFITLDLNGGTLSTTSTCIINNANLNPIFAFQNGTMTSSGSDCYVNFNAGLMKIQPSTTFGSAASSFSHMMAVGPASSIIIEGNYTISGGATRHYFVQQQARISGGGRTVTISGSPNFSFFARCTQTGLINLPAMTYTGAIGTGQCYNIDQNGVVSNGAGSPSPNYFPGTAGSVATGGIYQQ